ncbi:MAG: hypothetical protein JJE09_07030 [Bacteroidia bacterium]|nr:hypothetical protein [Bacteroidia bacterium]
MLNKVLKGSLFLISALFINTQTFGQWVIPSQMRNEVTLDRLLSSNGSSKVELLYGLPAFSGPPLGHNYIDQKWNNCSFLLFDSEKLMEGYLAKYDIGANCLAVKLTGGTRLIEVNKIECIVWLDSITRAPRYFINAKDFKEESIQLTGLLEVLVDGQMPLLAQSYLKEKEIGFFAGLLALFEKDKEKKYEVDNYFFVGNGTALSKIVTEKEFLLSFGDYFWEIEEYIEKNKLNISTPGGLKKVFEYYNAKFERFTDY